MDKKKAYYRPGQASDELAMFPLDLTNSKDRVDPGVALAEYIERYDPDHKISLELFWKLDEEYSKHGK